MIDETAAMLAVRVRAKTLVVATTGTMALEATATGYARAAGSFVTDGFRVGQDVTPTGFTQTTPGVISAVDALTMTIDGGRTVQLSGAGRSLASGLPTMRAFELINFTPTAGRPYVTEEWVPGTTGLTTWPADGGRLQEEFLAIWTWYGLPGLGISAIRRGVDAFKRLFAGGTIIAIGDGSSLRVRTDQTVKSGQLVRTDNGFAACQITVPLRSWTRNTVLA